MIGPVAHKYTNYVAQGLSSHFCDDAHDVIVGLRYMGFLHTQDYFWSAGPGRLRPGHLLRHLFFEKTKENKLSMKKLSKIILAAAMAALSPSSLFACAACYGRSSDPLAYGMNWGIFTLLGIVVLMLGSIATFFVIIIRREAAAQEKKLEADNLSGAQV